MKHRFWYAAGGALAAAAALTAAILLWKAVPDRIYRVGFEDDPPFHFRDSHGAPTGLIVEIVKDAARRKGVRIEWVYRPGSSEDALRSGMVDIWPLMTVLPERRKYFHFTDPYRESEACLVVRDESPYHKLQDMDGLRVTFNGMPIARQYFQRLIPGAHAIVVPELRATLQAVCRDQAEGAYMDEFSAVSALLAGPECGGKKLRVIQTPETRGLLALGSTFAAADAADAIRDGITDMVEAGELAALTARWSYFTGRSMELNTALVRARWDARVAKFAAGGALAMLLATAWLAWRLRRQRNRAVAAEKALSESEAYHHSLVDLMPDVLFVLNLDGSVRSMHPREVRLPGRPSGSLAGLRQQDIFPPESAARHVASIQRVLETGTIVAEEEMLGEDLWAETRLLPVRGADGRVESIMGIARDISGRKRIELRLIEHEERFRRIIETTGAGYFRIGVDGRYEDVNQAWLSMHGCTDKSEVVGRHYSEFQAEEDLGRADEVVRSVRTRRAETGEFSRRCKDGSLGFHTYSVNPVLAGHEVVGLEGFLIDTSARRAAQRAQVQSEARHAALFNHMAEGVALHELVFDEAGQPVNYRILDVNPKYEEILGLRRSDVVNRLATEVYGVADPPYLAEYTRMATLGEGGLFETYFAPLGKHFSVAIAQLGPGGFATIFTDITARKQAEAERIKLEEQLQQAQKMESIGRLAGGVAHDFNNLLTVINGYSDMMLAATGADDPLHRQVEQIRIAGERASNLTKQLLAFSRKQIIQPRPLDLNAELGASKAMLPRLLGEDIEIAYDLAEPAEPVMADPGQMQQVLMNLVVNARDAMPCGGKLRLETRNVRLSEEFTAKRPNLEPGAYVLLAVSDTGHGMDEGTLTHIFEPFFTTKGVGKGTGLGLSTVYGIVRQNGGWIEADSVPGQGSRFSIYLPCLKAQESERPKTVPAPGPARGTETILVVEDDEAVRHLSAEVLRGQGYTVLEAADGAAGLALGKDHAGTIHLLLADVVMPGLTGKEMADRLRVVRPEMKILFVSGYMDESVARQGGSEMGSNTLMKPVAPDVLAARVRQILG